MKNTIFCNIQARKFALRCLIYLPAVMICQFSGCKPVGQESVQTKKIAAPSVIEKSRTFQELGFFGEIKKDKWSGFLVAVQNNIKHSRKEQGIFLSVYTNLKMENFNRSGSNVLEAKRPIMSIKSSAILKMPSRLFKVHLREKQNLLH